MKRQEIKDFYAAIDWSGTNFTAQNELLVQNAQNVIQLLGGLPGNRILDLGCGSASLAVELAQKAFDVTGLDIHIAPAEKQ